MLLEWYAKYACQEQILLMDKAISDGLIDAMVPKWTELKAELLSILIEQVRKGREKELAPKNVRDVAICSKEIRALVDAHDSIDINVEIPK